jgi:hypothetical protein
MGRLYAPSYRGAYDLSGGDLGGLERLARVAAGLVVPLTLHWANEVKDGLRSFRALCARLAGATLTWSGYLALAERVKAQAAVSSTCP